MQRISLSLICICFICGTLRADTVIFKHKRRLNCQVIPPLEGADTVRVLLDGEGSRSMVLLLDTIEAIEYDYDSRLAKLAETDYPGHYELGLWCMERQLFPEALERLLYAKGNNDIPNLVLFYLGRVAEKMDPPLYREAYGYYKAFLETNPDEPRKGQALEALSRLEKYVKEKADDNELATVESTTNEGDGLETRNWASPNWGYNAETAVKQVKGEGDNSVLEIHYLNVDARGQRPTPDNMKTPVQLSLERNLAATPVLTFDVFNPAKNDVRFSIAFNTGANYEWFESPQITAPAGKWLVNQRVDLIRKIWKAQSTGWSHSASVANIDRACNLIILIYNGKDAGYLYFDSIRFKKSE